MGETHINIYKETLLSIQWSPHFYATLLSSFHFRSKANPEDT